MGVVPSRLHPVNDLSEAVEFLNGRSDLPVVKTDLDSIWNDGAPEELDFGDVKGSEACQARAGGCCGLKSQRAHVGPPRSGKTMLARAYPGSFLHLVLAKPLKRRRFSV